MCYRSGLPLACRNVSLPSCDRAALPVSSFAADIIAAVRAFKAVIIAADTGCGKSQALMAAEFKQIAVTQPRRLAAVSLCRRVAFETLNEYGDEIAYKIR
jgi:HrpA-like RNA helicase